MRSITLSSSQAFDDHSLTWSRVSGQALYLIIFEDSFCVGHKRLQVSWPQWVSQFTAFSEPPSPGVAAAEETEEETDGEDDQPRVTNLPQVNFLCDLT